MGFKTKLDLKTGSWGYLLGDLIDSTYTGIRIVEPTGDAQSDTNNIHAARDSGAKELWFSDGTFLVTGLEANVADQTWRLSSGATIKLTADAAQLQITAAGVTILGGIWDGNSQATGSKRQIQFEADDFRIEGATIFGSGSAYGLNVLGASNGIIRGNRFPGALTKGIFVNATATDVSRNNLIEGNFIYITGGTTNHGIQVHSANAGGDVTGTRILDNYIEVGSTDAFGIEVGAFSGDTPNGIIISRNRIKAMSSHFGGISVSLADHCNVSNNVYDNNGQTATIAGIEFVNNSKGVVKGNILMGSASMNQGITVGGAQADSNDNIVSNNLIDGFSNAAGDDFGIGINKTAAGEAKRNIVSDNIVKMAGVNAGVGYRAIIVRSTNASSDVTDNIVSGNIIVGNGDNANFGIVVDKTNGTNARNKISGNTIFDTQTGIFDGADNTLLFMNRMESVPVEYSGSATNRHLVKIDETNLSVVLNTLGVANSAAATTPGSVTDKIEVFDDAGASLGFIAVYGAIT